MIARKALSFLKSATIGVSVIFCFGAAGEICGSFFDKTASAFGSNFSDNKPDDIRKVMARLSKDSDAQQGKPANQTGRPLAVLVAEGEPRKLIAVDLSERKSLWNRDLPVHSHITIGDDAVIFLSGNEVVALALDDGRTLWGYEVEEGWEYRGAAAGGGVVVFSVGVGGESEGGYGIGRLIALKEETGGTLWENNSGGGLLGQPAVEAKMIFVPWDRQKVAVLDLYEGREIARVRGDDYPIHYVEADAGAVYMGSNSTAKAVAALLRFDEAAATGKKEGSTVFVPRLAEVPGNPGFDRDAFSKPAAGRSASEKIQFHWKPAPAPPGGIAMADGAFYLHYWRYIIAFEAETSEVRWTYRSAKDIESMDVVDGGVIGVDSQGRLFFVNGRSGAEAWAHDTGAKVLTAVFDAAGVDAGSGGIGTGPFEGLHEIIWDKDNRMLPIRAYAAMLMADLPEPKVTQNLLEVYSDASTPVGLRKAVVKALKKRTSGAEYLVSALHMRYDFLERTQPAPMDVVAPALVNMEERSAVPGLLTHLMDHETPVENIEPIAKAIHALGDPSVAPTLRHFLVLYHADSSMLGHEDALAAVAAAYLEFGGETGRQLLESMKDEPQTLPDLKQQIASVLSPQAEQEAGPDEAVATAEQTSEPERPAATHAIPLRRDLPRDTINKAIAENKALFAPCVQAALGQKPNLQSIRMRFVITGNTGRASDLRVLPLDIPGLAQCLENGFSELEFPRFENLRQQATYVIRISGVRQANPAFVPEGGQQVDPDAFGAPAPTPSQVQPKPNAQAPSSDPQAGDPDAF